MVKLFCYSILAYGQITTENKVAPPPSIKKPTVFKIQPYSIFLGYGTRGINLKADMELADFNNGKSSTRVYFDGTYNPMKFSQPNLTFNSQNYSSNVFLLTVGGGFSQEFLLDRFTVAPLLGLKYNYVRFTDGALVNAIGTNGLIRYRYDNWGNQVQVGPDVNNGYGNSINFEVGTRLGIKLADWLELNGTFAYSPITFETSSTMFGEYWGEAPYTNQYYVNPTPLKAEGNIRITFGH